jgi:hypothetical protein
MEVNVPGVAEVAKAASANFCVTGRLTATSVGTC